MPLRYLLTFVRVVTPVRQFFESAIADRVELEAIECAWTKAVHLHVTLMDPTLQPATECGSIRDFFTALL